jgi:hypothetical protein
LAVAGAQHREIREYLTYMSIMARGMTSVAHLLITSASDVKKFRRPAPSEARYVRPSRRYELPPYVEGTGRPRSRECYLRPTRYCNPCAPEVVALADALGAGRLPVREYAEAAFFFAKEKLTLEIAPIDSVEASLRRGTGTCFDLISVFIALCRAAGIPARYKIFATDMVQAWRQAVIDVDPLLKKWYDALGYFLLEGEGEAYVDGEWVVAHVGPTAERQAASGIPITRFGEDSLGVWFRAKPGTIMRPEALPPGLAAGSRALHAISPGSMERVNISVCQQIERGRQVIAEAGGSAAYDRRARAAPTEQPSGEPVSAGQMEDIR